MNIEYNFFDSMANRIYPSELQLNKASVSDAKALFLDLHLSILIGFVKTKIYYKLFFLIVKDVNVPLGCTELLHSATTGRKLQCFQGGLQNMRVQTKFKSR